MTAIGTVKMRYPGGDPENGPAYPQRWTGKSWECAEHRFKCWTDEDPETGEQYTGCSCTRCGEDAPTAPHGL